jgi:hypothetical protein
VLISPYAVKQPLVGDKKLDVNLSRQQVRDSPDIDTHQPVTRQHEREYLSHYDYPAYWEGAGLWGMGPFPLSPPYPPSAAEIAEDQAMKARDRQAADVHLRSTAAVTGYTLQASDDSIGHVQDLVFDDESWAIRYFVVDTRNWWPGGKKVLIATHWVNQIDWATRTVHVTLTRDEVKHSPTYQEDLTIDRGYEQRLHSAYRRRGYWD